MIIITHKFKYSFLYLILYHIDSPKLLYLVCNYITLNKRIIIKFSIWYAKRKMLSCSPKEEETKMFSRANENLYYKSLSGK